MRAILVSLLVLVFLSANGFSEVVGAAQIHWTGPSGAEAGTLSASKGDLNFARGTPEARGRCCMGDQAALTGGGDRTPCLSDCPLFMADEAVAFPHQSTAPPQMAGHGLVRSGAPPPFRPPIYLS